MFTPQHGSVDWSPDNSLKSLQHLRQLITLKQREKFFIFAVITERVIEGPRERERKVRWGAKKKARTRGLFSQRDGQNLTLNRARLLSPWHRVASDRHARWHVTVLASSRQTRLGNFLPSASKKKRNPPDDGNDSSHLITQSEVWLLTSLIGGLLLNITPNNKRGIKRRGGGEGLVVFVSQK